MPFSTMAKEQIKAIRVSLGMTQEEFAESLGVKQAAVSHWEQGLRRPSGSAELLIKQLQKRPFQRKSKIFTH